MRRLLVAALGLHMAMLVNPAFGQTLETIATNGVYQSQRPHSAGQYTSAVNKTFVTWSGPNMDVYVRAYNHATAAWEPAVRARDNNFTNYHNYPTIIRAPNGRLLVFFFNHQSAIYQLTSASADSVEGAWSFRNISPAGVKPGYPTPVVAGSDIYLFYRQNIGVTYYTLNFIKSSDNGATWSAPKTIIDTGNLQTDNLNTVYPNDVGYEAASGSTPARIRLSWHLAGGAFHNEKSKNVYLAYYVPSSGLMNSASNGNLGTVIDSNDFVNQSSNGILVRQALPSGSTLQAVNSFMPSRPMSNQSNRPIVGWNFRDSTGVPVASIGRWSGSSWVVRGIPGSGTLRDFQVVDSSRLRALRVDGTQITVYETADWGDSWSTSYSVNAAGQLVNGADTIFGGIALSTASSPLDFFFTTFDYDQRDTDYTGKWRVFVLRQ